MEGLTDLRFPFALVIINHLLNDFQGWHMWGNTREKDYIEKDCQFAIQKRQACSVSLLETQAGQS